MRDAQRFDRTPDAFGDADCAEYLGLRQQYQKLLPAVAHREIVDIAQLGANAGRDTLEAGIACDVAVAIVEQFEMIDVEHDHGHGRNGVVSHLPQLGQPRGEMMPVGEIGERIALGSFLHFDVPQPVAQNVQIGAAGVALEINSC